MWQSRRMRHRSSLPIVAAGLLPVLVSVPGIYLGVLQIADGLRARPAGGVVGLGLVLGFWLVLGSLFVICLTALLTGVALDIRDLRNDRVVPNHSA